MAKFIEEFKAFALKGNVMDMAVGVIIGGAFGKIVSSLVDDIIMPLCGILMGGKSTEDLVWKIKEATIDQEALVLSYGKFIQNIIDFLIIAISVFLMVKAINKLSSLRKKEEEPAAEEAPEPTAEEKLLTEIRDLLKEKK